MIGGLLLLDLSNKKLTSLPPELLSTNPELFSIRVQNNKLANLPNDFLPKDCQLKSIDFSTNKLQSLPESIEYSQTLVEVIVPNNVLEVSPDFSKVKTLEVLQLNNNKLVIMPNVSTLNRLKTLNLSNNKLKSLGAGALSGLYSLEQLILRTNCLSEISEIASDAIWNLPKLVMLDLSENQLEAFQIEGEIPALESLFISL